MIVYMLLNSATDMVYIGRTHGTLKARVKEHWCHALKEKGTTFLSEAIRDWPDFDSWEFIVLQSCYSEQQLNDSEAAWITICSARDRSVGYNMQFAALSAKNETLAEYGRKGAARSKELGKSKTKAEMTEAERERYREWGRKGARVSKEKALLRT